MPCAGRRVLELGCGPGKFVALLASLGYEVVGVDPSSFPDWELIKNRHHDVEFREEIVAEALPFEDRSFDHVACLGALLYFDDPARGLREMARVIRPNGHLVLRTPNRDNLYTRRTGKRLDPASRNLYTMAELQALLRENGFQVKRSFSFGFWPPFAPDLYWYVVSVWMPLSLQTRLSNLTPAHNRVNNIVFARAV